MGGSQRTYLFLSISRVCNVLGNASTDKLSRTYQPNHVSRHLGGKPYDHKDDKMTHRRMMTAPPTQSPTETVLVDEDSWGVDMIDSPTDAPTEAPTEFVLFGQQMAQCSAFESCVVQVGDCCPPGNGRDDLECCGT